MCFRGACGGRWWREVKEDESIVPELSRIAVTRGGLKTVGVRGTRTRQSASMTDITCRTSVRDSESNYGVGVCDVTTSTSPVDTDLELELEAQVRDAFQYQRHMRVENAISDLRLEVIVEFRREGTPDTEYRLCVSFDSS